MSARSIESYPYPKEEETEEGILLNFSIETFPPKEKEIEERLITRRSCWRCRVEKKKPPVREKII